ncbi:Ankyrin repeat-containing protein [Glarea lozoyensis ATCC 20868]|uniref:Ankyrin repeat-containing protein n=1 Tax=Glarea lozoyensis (strain ATCC 20868 / MF5171) TaxID=1116229 RepID=S3CVL2_GLAL2|nr:Ankyrin repeat-containing protein [Glarea lozoyensis ATCC 20868]EPE30452.1 Ankyrin repeat-containing protein [Glarea lozoyensis ATCC 20868]
MAEIFGVVAGGIGVASFVAQIGDNLIKLKNITDSMKDAPKELRSIIQNVEELGHILESIRTRARYLQIPDGADDIIDHSLASCHAAAQELYQVATHLELLISGNGRKGRFKFAVKKQGIEDLRRKLEETKSNIQLAHIASNIFFQQHQYFSHINQQRINQQICQELQRLKTTDSRSTQSADLSVSSTKDTPVHSSHEIWKGPSVMGFLFGGVQYSFNQYSLNKNDSRKSKSAIRSVAKVRIFTPQWISRNVYEAQIIQDRWSCSFNLRPYSIVPVDCELFHCVGEGNVEGIQRLFNLGLATPFDRDIHGFTALHYAVYNHRAQACKLLLDEGAEAFALDGTGVHGKVPIHWLDSEIYDHSVKEILSLFFHENQDALISFGDGKSMLESAFVERYQAMELSLKYAYPPYSERSTEDKIEFVLTFSLVVHPRALELALGEASLERHQFEICDSAGYTLTECIIRNLVCNALLDPEIVEECFPILQQAIRSHIDLYRPDRNHLTIISLLLLFYAGYSSYVLTFRDFCPSGKWLLKKYLKCLVLAGVDLTLYGAKEREIHQNERKFSDVHTWRICHDWGNHEDCFAGFYSFCIKYGPTIHDWDVWDDRAANYEYAEDFWEMIESPWEQLPGAWID